MNVLSSEYACILFVLYESFKTDLNSNFSELQQSLQIYFDNVRKQQLFGIRGNLARLTGDFGHLDQLSTLVLTNNILRAITQDDNICEIIRRIIFQM